MIESITLLALAIAPGIALSIYFYVSDKYEKEPKWLLILAFVLGMVSIFPAILMGNFFDGLGLGKTDTSLGVLLYAFITIAFSEELSKYFFFYRLTFKNPEFNEPYDGIIYSVMVALGFATLENIFYVFEHGYTTAILRMFTAVPAHATFGVLMGFFVGLAKFRRFSLMYKILGLLSAVLFHGLYDFFLMNKAYEWMFVGALVSLYLAVFLSRKAVKLHQIASPFR